MFDEIARPRHYNIHPSGIECIQITEHMNFCLGNAIKYIWRAGEKESTTRLTDLRKAHWYLTREIERLVDQEINNGSRHAIREEARSTPPTTGAARPDAYPLVPEPHAGQRDDQTWNESMSKGSEVRRYLPDDPAFEAFASHTGRTTRSDAPEG